MGTTGVRVVGEESRNNERRPALDEYSRYLRETIAGCWGDDDPLVGDPMGRRR